MSHSKEYDAAMARLNERQQKRNLYVNITEEDVLREIAKARRAKEQLSRLRREIVAERISYGEIAELQDLVEYIEPGDVLLLQWAGVPEHERRSRNDKASR